MRRLRLGTRGSLLARTQSAAVASALERASGRPVELVEIRTRGDRIQNRPLVEIGGMGLFTREVDEALLDGEVDFAVHSLKDLPTVLPEGIMLGAVPEREDPRDVLVLPAGAEGGLDDLPGGARVGTGSQRRRALALAHRPDLEVRGIRGNLDTRIGKVDAGEYAAILLAAAGLRRMGWTRRASQHLDAASWLPAPGQGALAVVARRSDEATLALLRLLDHPPSRSATEAERTILHALGAGCQLPVGALGLPFGGGMRLRAMVASPDGRRMIRASATGAQDDARALGERVAAELISMGAESILAGGPAPKAARPIASDV
ncbi:MAG: hydroxymethylbilane synthase [Gemmatimonadota bacterium]